MRDRCSTAELHSDCLFRDTYLIIFKKYSFLKVGFFFNYRYLCEYGVCYEHVQADTGSCGTGTLGRCGC